MEDVESDYSLENEQSNDQLNKDPIFATKEKYMADDVHMNSRAKLEKASNLLIAENDRKEAKTLFEGSFLENSEAILETLNMLLKQAW